MNSSHHTNHSFQTRIDVLDSFEESDSSNFVIHDKIDPILFSRNSQSKFDDDECTYRTCNSRPRKSGLRSKFMLEGIKLELMRLKRQNEQLRKIVREHIKPIDVAIDILKRSEVPIKDIFLQSSILLDDQREFEEDGEDTPAYTLKSEDVTQVTSAFSNQFDFTEKDKEELKSIYTENSKVDPSVYEGGDIQILAAALNGDFAF